MEEMNQFSTYAWTISVHQDESGLTLFPFVLTAILVVFLTRAVLRKKRISLGRLFFLFVGLSILLYLMIFSYRLEIQRGLKVPNSISSNVDGLSDATVADTIKLAWEKLKKPNRAILKIEAGSEGGEWEITFIENKRIDALWTQGASSFGKRVVGLCLVLVEARILFNAAVVEKSPDRRQEILNSIRELETFERRYYKGFPDPEAEDVDIISSYCKGLLKECDERGLIQSAENRDDVDKDQEKSQQASELKRP